MKNKLLFVALFVLAINVWAQGVRETGAQVATSETQLPLRRVVILTSGLAYYQHSGSVNGAVSMPLIFKLDSINDALSSLVINDPSSTNPSVTYQGENTLFHTLRSLSVDLSDSPDMAAILARLRGAEVEITTQNDASASFTGRIIGIEYRMTQSAMNAIMEPWLLLNNEGLRQFNIRELSSIRFTDSVIENDFNRALDLIAASRNVSSRRLLVNLPGTNRRDVTLSYVIPTPVWKVSYRLDLGSQRSLFQGWAIVDNDSDIDWNNIELSLVAGRPTSFIQELYPPYYVNRPVLPLAIAGAARAVTHERGVAESSPEADAPRMRNYAADTMAMEAEEMAVMRQRAPAPAPTSAASVAGGAVQTAAGNEAGGQFEFTIRNPVTLNRRMSAMFPLVEFNITARPALIYNGQGRFPRLGAELTNTSGMKLPAGPITVYSGGVYAGDALIDFWNENEKRLISFGEDLSVTAAVSGRDTNAISTVRISNGVMNISRHITFIRTYTFNNTSSDAKQLIVEHNRTMNTELVSPRAEEETASIYRFNVALPANRQTEFAVSERRVLSENVTLLPLRIESFLMYVSNQEIPANVRSALQRAVDLRRAVDTADASVREIEANRNRLIADQDRVRRNLEATGNESAQGQEYLRRLVALDGEIDTLGASLQRATNDARAARAAYEQYLANLSL